MRKLLILAVLCGDLFYIPTAAAPHASASPPAAPTVSAVVPASGSPPEVVVTAVRTAPLVRVTVRPGDTLSGIAASHRSQWPRLAAYNHISNPDLVLVGQVVVIPPASYRGWYIGPAPRARVSYTPPVRVSTIRTHTPQVTYTPPAPAPVVSHATGGGTWACIAQRESGGNAATNTGNGYYGAFQDTISAWRAGGGGPGLPSNYSYSEQLRVNQNLQAQVGWGAWPNTSRACGV